jgi:hypothetical protein
MDPIRLTAAEKTVFDNVQNGVATEADDLKDDKILRALALRHIILGLPVEHDNEGVLLKAASLIGLAQPQARCQVTGVGIAITGATISGRLNLDSAIGHAGGPLCPLSFTDCHFQDQIMAPHAHFSRLGFSLCTFGSPVTDMDPIPSIDLSGARLNGRLDMDKIKSYRDGGLLWIRAPGLCVGGGINLSGCSLRAPPCTTDEGPDAVDLTSATINGDLSLDEDSHIVGGVRLRAASIQGDVWLRNTKLESTGDCREALLLQGAKIGGFLALCARDPSDPWGFDCTGRIDLTAAEIGRSLVFRKAVVRGDIKAPDLIVRDDFFLHAEVEDYVDLEHCTIGGSLDISDLRIRPGSEAQPENPPPPLTEPVSDEVADQDLAASAAPMPPRANLSLKDGTIGRELRLAPRDRDPDACFLLSGIADLRGLSCDTLNDEIGRRWGKDVLIRMDHFTYRRTGWVSAKLHGRRAKPSYRNVSDWIQARRADGRWPWRLFPKWWLSKDPHFWEPWQLRRNWIYQQYDSTETRAAIADPFQSMARHEIYEEDFSPQPFEQAIRVARSEGREDFATQFEMHKQSLEWRLFNLRVRWGLGGLAITLAALWLCIHDTKPIRIGVTIVAWAATIALMIFGSWFREKIEDRLKKDRPEAPGERLHLIAKTRVRVGYWTPALLLFSFWAWTPFHFLIALMIFSVIRLLGVFSHAIMRFGFGYLRRPIYAVATLITAFLLGWGGVSLAKSRDMFVVAAEPTAGQAAIIDPTNSGGRDHERLLLMGSEAYAGRFVRDVPCSHEISEPLYALDLLIPIVDLGEERRCEVRRFPAPGRPVVHPSELNPWTLATSIFDLPLNDNRFWWWMKALYAIAGWVLVSLAILTFAQVNKIHAEPPHEHK